jgi:SIR2-like domain/NACHT domain
MPGPLPDQHAKILAQKLADGQLALFVGAGLSRQAIVKDGSGRRLPLWKELAEQVAKARHEDLEAYGGNILDLFDAIELGQSRFTLEQAVRAVLDDAAFDPSPAHRALAELPWAAVYTTNYDGLLGRMLNADPVFEEEQYDRLQLSADRRPRLFHVHGTLAKPHTLTREDYRLWPEKHPRAFRDLEHVILNKTVLFVGYSLSDPHLADGVLPTVRKITAGREKRLYAWMWKTPQNQVQLLDRRDKIKAIPIQGDEDWAAAFRQVADALGKVERASGAAVGAAADPFAYDRQQYFAAIDARYGIANLQGLYVSGAGYARSDVLLSEVYVEPDLVVSPSALGTTLGQDGFTDASATIEAAFKIAIAAAVSKAASGKGRRDALSAALKKRAEDEHETATRRERSSQVMAREARLLIVGAPGEGKSTLLRDHLLQGTARWRERPTEHPFPIFVRLADWEAEGGASDGRLFRFLGSRLPAMGEIGSKAVEQWFRGQVLWLLDGIDEIRDAGERLRIVEEVKATSAVRIHDRWIVSTRPAGEPRGGLDAGWTRAVLPSLSEAQVEGVLARWGSVLKTKEGLPLDAPQVARDLRKDPGLRQVRTNALLLTLAILFFKTRKRLPHDRWEFYDAADKSLTDAWVRHRISSAEDYLPGDYLPDLLERLALSGMENGHVLFERETLKKETRAVLRRTCLYRA